MGNLIIFILFAGSILFSRFGKIFGETSILFDELFSKFEDYLLKKDDSKEIKNVFTLDESICNKFTHYSSSESKSTSLNLEFNILNVPLVHDGFINIICNCKNINSEGVSDINIRSIKALNCTSTNNLINTMDTDNDDLSLIEDEELVESLKDIYNNRKLGLEILLTLNDQSEDFCRLSILGLKDKLVLYPKLNYEHFSLIEIGMAFCFYLGKLNNFFFDHPSPVTEILEGDIFDFDQYISNEIAFDDLDEEIDVDEWKYVEENSIDEFYESTEFSRNLKLKNRINFRIIPFLRLSYISKKPYPRVYIKPNVPYNKAIAGLNRSIPNNYYSIAGKWQISITPGYTSVNDDDSILSILGSKINSANKEKYILNKLKEISNKWRDLKFSSTIKEFSGCFVGRNNYIPKINDSFKILDPTDSQSDVFLKNLNTETIFEIMNSNIDFNILVNDEKSPCSYLGNIRNCLKLIRTRIRDKSISYILGNLFINTIYKLWITWGSSTWYMKSLFNIENLFQSLTTNEYSKNSENDYIITALTRLFNIEPLIDDENQDIISVLKENLNNNSTLRKDVFQFGILSLNPLLIESFWEMFSKTYCEISSDAAFVTWIANKFTLSYNYKDIKDIDDDEDINDQIELYNYKEFSWLLKPLPNYFDKINPKVEVELEKEDNLEINLPEFFEFNDLVEIYSKNEPINEKLDSEKRKRFFNSNYFNDKNKNKWVSFIVKNVPFRDLKKRNLEFKCNKGSWPYKGGDISWMGYYMCEVVFMSSLFNFKGFDFSTYYDYYEDESYNDKMSHIRKLNRNRMIGIEFETSYPHRCGIGYLGNESTKAQTDVKGSNLLRISLGFCIMNGFKLQWLSDDSFNIYTEILYKYTQSLENGLTYYERNGFELSGSVQQKVYSNTTCSGIFLNDNLNSYSNYSFTSQIINCKVSYDPIIVTDGIRSQELKYMRDKYINLLYNMKFECVDENSNDFSNINSHCSTFYPLLKNISKGSNKICMFEKTKEWKIINKEFPHVCKIGGRIGSCHNEIRKNKVCNKKNKKNCNLDLFITDNFIKPINMELIENHLNNISFLLMNGIKKFTENWDSQSIALIKNILSDLILEDEFDLYYNKGINFVFEERMSLFMKELQLYEDDPVLIYLKDLFSSSGIWLDTYSLPILWRLAIYRIEDIPFFANENMFSTFNNDLSSINRIFRSKFSYLKNQQNINNREENYNFSIPLYCPQAIGYFWIDKYMWQMYRYPGTNLERISPIR